MQQSVIPKSMGQAYHSLKFSPGILSGGHLFLTGMTGSRPNGSMPDDLETQFHNAFGKIETILAEARLDFRAIVEMTSYHVGLQEHFDLFDGVRKGYVHDPYPAWTAVEVAGLRRHGAAVEIRVVAHVSGQD